LKDHINISTDNLFLNTIFVLLIHANTQNTDCSYCYALQYIIEYTVSQKSSLLLPSCKPIQIIFGRNIADKIWNKLTHGNFDIYSSASGQES